MERLCTVCFIIFCLPAGSLKVRILNIKPNYFTCVLYTAESWAVTFRRINNIRGAQEQAFGITFVTECGEGHEVTGGW